MQNTKTSLTVICVIVSISTVFAYWPALYNGFVWDDKIFLFKPEYLDPNSWWDILTSPFDVSVNYFRPLVLLSYIGELYFLGLQPFSFHATNLTLHVLNTILVILLVWHVLSLQQDITLSRRKIVSLLAGLMYGLHPATVEATAWISGRFDLMLTFFSLALLYADAKIEKVAIRVIVVGLLFLLAALSKEMAAAMGVVLPFWHLAMRRHQVTSIRGYLNSIKLNGDLYVYTAIIAAGLVYLICRYSALGYLYLPDSPLDVGTPIQRLLLVGKSVGWYGLIGLMPFITLSPIHYEQFPITLNDPLAWVAIATILWVGVRTIQGIRSGNFQLWYWVAAFCSMLPVINVIPLTIGDSIVHERFLQYPLAMIAIAGAVFTARIRPIDDKGRKIVYGALVVSVLALCLANVRVTAAVWHDNVSLWYWTALKNPDSAIAVGNLAAAYKDAGQAEISLEYGLKSLLAAPKHANGWIIVGNSLSELGLPERAEPYLRTGAVMKPNDPFAINNLGAVLIKLRRYDEAESVLQDGLKIAPQNRMLNRNLGILYLRTEKKDMALKHFKIAYAYLSYEDLVKDLTLQTAKAESSNTQRK